ncbi:hypothetical protein D3C78_1866180 [compost metagenome]
MCQNLSRIFGQQTKQLEFARRQMYLFPVRPHAPGRIINFQMAVHKARGVLVQLIL